MTNLAYLVFTFVACVLGLGLGLLLHHFSRLFWRKEDIAVDLAAAGEEAVYEKLVDMQMQDNRRFAVQVSSCAALPLIAALAGFEERSSVVGSICHSIVQVAGQSPLCF